ncbi:MAG: type II secretion system protein [Planctomycetota bacterium]|nr:type II secretion system protein [Planctomycetota bacterium]
MLRSLDFQYGVRRTSGFTLLELLLVVFIMSVLAFSAVSLTDVMDSSQDQYRYERAKNQAVELKKAIIDRVETQQVVRGFVADVGALPANMTELAFGVVDKDPTDELILASSLQQPIYDFTPDAEGFNNGDGIPLTTSLNLVKGFRGAALQTDEGSPRNFYIGSYLSDLLPGKNIYDGLTKPRFDDGWGNQNGSFSTTLTVPASNALSLDDQTHGWVWNYDGNLSISTFGKDGVSGGTEYSEDLILASISPDDWSVTPSDIQVELYNDLANLNLGTPYAFVILAFNAKRDLWQTVVSASFQIPQVGQIATTSFPSYLSTFRVPAGKHVLMLIENSGSHLTPITSVTEKISGTDSNPEVQTLVLSPEPALTPNRVKLSMTLPDPTDPFNSITEESQFRQTITAAISDLNSDFVNAGFNSDPITFSGNNSSGNLTIELSESSSGQLNNENVSMMTVTRESIPNTYRAKHIHVLPGQANTFRLNLSSITAP